ncbi:MAG: PAS domain-containing protein, partial [Candidatus Methylomirabilales bacterium]
MGGATKPGLGTDSQRPLAKDLDLLRGACEAVFLLDADLCIRWANPRAVALAGATLSVLLAQSIKEVLETDALQRSPLHQALEEDRGVHGVSAHFKVGGGQWRAVRLTAIPVGSEG